MSHRVTFYLHFSLITLEMILSFISDYPHHLSPQHDQGAVDERQPLLQPNQDVTQTNETEKVKCMYNRKLP